MKKFVFTFAVIVVAGWLGGFIWFARAINNFRTADEPHTQAVIALTGGRNRIAEAARLLNEGAADKMFISGVDKQSSFAAIRKRQGISIADERRVAIGKKATNTVENAAETREWIRANNIKSIRLVTSNYHIPRSIAEFKAQNPGITIIGHPVYSEKVEKKWWKSWHTFSLIFAEYNKFLYVYLRSNLLD